MTADTQKVIIKNTCQWSEIFINREGISHPYDGIDITPETKNILFTAKRDVPLPYKRDILNFELDVFSPVGVAMLKDAIEIIKLMPYECKVRTKYNLYKDYILSQDETCEFAQLLKEYFRNYKALTECFNFPLFSSLEYKISKKNELSFKLLK